ncbi:hypothetical protein Ppb6_00663 [Photorhabdus australis subsp. thailandensis]|uniref:HTH cro/C1-type domain-containing protein n=1 Tax=Photorhabdus australis subsp. thailandensis TaxID=2805096 RepID=A0A1C0U8A9_9GAMM|nr:transcriptional regulator [Photorhabdus australis]OCQ54113.1 hypothetical protein Ppb6_00663 [Photorhabdus australis subsp. thailandensis]
MKGNKIGSFIEAAIIVSGKTQALIAKEVGYEKANNLSMIKSGKLLLPVDKVPAFAKALGVDEANLLTLVLEERYPSLLEIFKRHAEILTEDEAKVLKAYRKAKSEESLDPDNIRHADMSKFFQDLANKYI